MGWQFFFDPEVLRQMVFVATPLVLAAQGELLIQRSGILNVSIEGMMALGAVVGFLVAYVTGAKLFGLVAAALAAAILGLVLGYAAITLHAPQLTIGLALFILGTGLSSLLYRMVIGLRFLPPMIATFPAVEVPVLSELPIVGRWLFRVPAPSYVVIGVVAIMHLFLFHTTIGLRVRATGENPRCADSLGIPVTRLRYACLMIGGMLIGVAGALLPMMLTGTYSEGMVGGRGWISLMLVILGRWVPFGTLMGAWLFGYVDALQYRLGLTIQTVPPQFMLMLPYVFVVLVAIRAYRGAQAPQALLKPYDREARA